MPAATISAIGGRTRASAPGIKAINIGGPTTLTFGASESLSTGNPAAPCLQMQWVGQFRFRMVFYPGTWAVSILVMQACNTTPRPSMTVRKNTDMGINADVVGSAPSGTGWVTIGPISVTVSALGGTYVDLQVNSTAEAALPCFWDHLVRA